jgi:hypothetical protein
LNCDHGINTIPFDSKVTKSSNLIHYEIKETTSFDPLEMQGLVASGWLIACACTSRCLFHQTVGALINPHSTKQVPWEQELEKKPNKTKTNGIDS